MDFIGPLPKTAEGYQYILLAVCSFSKWCEAFPLKSQDAVTTAQCLYTEIICRYGAPRELLTDRGQNFASKLIAEVCKLFEVTKLQTSSYHPQTNATCERLNSPIEQTLRAKCKPDQSDWHQVLPSVLRAYRTTPATESTGFSPFYMLFLREPEQPIDTELLPTPNIGKDATKYLKELKEKAAITWKIATENTAAAQEKYTHQHNKKAVPPTFENGQRVWLYCSRTKPGLSPKLSKKWIGPYYICTQNGNNTYMIRTMEHKLVKSPAHANRLKPYIDPEERPTNQPELLDETEDIDPDELEDENADGETQSQNQPEDKNRANQPNNQPGTSKSTTKNQKSLIPKMIKQKPNIKDDEDKTVPATNNANKQKKPNNKQTGTPKVHRLRRENIKLIMKCRNKAGKREYFVRFWNEKGDPDWYYENDLPADLVREFHVKKTHSGRAHKRNKHI
jgi:hypothetical protein